MTLPRKTSKSMAYLSEGHLSLLEARKSIDDYYHDESSVFWSINQLGKKVLPIFLTDAHGAVSNRICPCLTEYERVLLLLFCRENTRMDRRRKKHGRNEC